MSDKLNRQPASSDEYEYQPFIWSKDLTQDDLREMVIARFDRIAREVWDKAKKPRPLDTIGEMEVAAVVAFFRAFELRMKRAEHLERRGFGLETPPQHPKKRRRKDL